MRVDRQPAVVVSVLLPASCAALAVVALLGLPEPRRDLVTGPVRRWRLPPAPVPVAAGLLAGALLGPVAGLAGAGGGLLAVRAHRSRAARREREDERRAALEALEVLAAELRAGRPASTALAAAAEVAVGGTGRVLLAAARGERVGADAGAVLQHRAEDAVVPHVLRSLGACWQVCSGTGSGLAAAVTRLADGVRAEQEQRRAVEAELAGPRATAALLALLPVAGTLLAAGLGADPLHVLLHTPVGVAALAAGTALELAGLWWTERIVLAAGGVP